MSIEVSGIGGEHFEPLPREIHELFHPEQEVPQLTEAYPGQLEAMYAAGGWRFAGMVACRPGALVGEMIRGLEPHAKQGLGERVLIGPMPSDVERSLEQNWGRLRGIALYAQM